MRRVSPVAVTRLARRRRDDGARDRRHDRRVQRDERHSTRPLPFPESARVVALQAVVRNGRIIYSLAYPDFMDFRRTDSDFAELTIYQSTTVTLQHGADPQPDDRAADR